MANISDGVLIGEQGSAQTSFFNSANMIWFSIGSMLASKMMAVFANANAIIDNGGTCDIMFKFNGSDIAGTVRHSTRVDPLPKSQIFTDIYKLVEILALALEEAENAE